jgi:hypothetical protein
MTLVSALDDVAPRRVPGRLCAFGNGSSTAVIHSHMNCGEKPQRVVLEDSASRSSESWDGQLRDRTLKQGESDRMSY